MRKPRNEAYPKTKKAGWKPKQQSFEPIMNSSVQNNGCLNCNYDSQQPKIPENTSPGFFFYRLHKF